MNVITDTDALAALCDRLSSADYVTVDTEFMRESTFWPILCLVQVAGPEDEAIIDPLADGIDLTPLCDLIADENVLKVMHAAKQDIEIFHHEGGVTPVPLFDTQIAAMVAGFGDQVGYETLIAKLTKVRPDKGSRFTDWSQRPLTKAQLEYALADVTHLRPAYEKLRRRIEENGRLAWVEEEMVKLADPALYEVIPEEGWRRLKPKRNQPKYLAMLQAVAAWRDREAMARDLPRNRLMRDDVLSQIAAAGGREGTVQGARHSQEFRGRPARPGAARGHRRGPRDTARARTVHSGPGRAAAGRRRADGPAEGPAQVQVRHTAGRAEAGRDGGRPRSHRGG
jgi:ribonuclease D